MTAVASVSMIDCPMLQTVTGRPTDYWNDSCAQDELAYAVARGATGATSNPSIVLEVLRKERSHWTPRIVGLARKNESWTETDITWAIIEEMAVRGVAVLQPVFAREGGRKGRLSIQTNPANYAWQVQFNGSGITPEDRIDEPVDPAIVGELLDRIPDFGRAYEPDGLTLDEFDRYGATVRTLRGFIKSYHDLVGAVRDLVLPDPDVRPA